MALYGFIQRKEGYVLDKKTYVEPEVTKVEFEFNETIAASGCTRIEVYQVASNAALASQCAN